MNSCHLCFFIHIVKVFFHSFFEFSTSLSNILFVAVSACCQVDNSFCVIYYKFFFCLCRYYLFRGINIGTQITNTFTSPLNKFQNDNSSSGYSLMADESVCLDSPTSGNGDPDPSVRCKFHLIFFIVF